MLTLSSQHKENEKVNYADKSIHNLQLLLNKYVGPPYCPAEMYTGHITCFPLVLSMPTGQTDGRTDARPLHYACH